MSPWNYFNESGASLAPGSALPDLRELSSLLADPTAGVSALTTGVTAGVTGGYGYTEDATSEPPGSDIMGTFHLERDGFTLGPLPGHVLVAGPGPAYNHTRGIGTGSGGVVVGDGVGGVLGEAQGNGSMPSLRTLPPESQAVLIILYSVTTLLAVSGNVLVILVFTMGKRSRTDLRGFLINLAVADLIMALFCMPFTFTMTMLNNWVFSAPMCPIVLYMQTVSVTASVCTNMAIGIDRFWVVTFPLKSRLTKSRSKVVIGVIWVISLGLSSVQLGIGRSDHIQVSPGVWITTCEEVWPEPSDTWRRAYTFFILLLTYIMPLTILALSYGIVGTRLWQRTTPGNADEVRDSHQLKSKRKVIKMLVVVVVLFGICWLPLHVFILVLDFHPELVQYASPAQEKFFTAIYYSVHWLAMSNSFVNPIIYGFLNDSFRSDMKRLWRRWFPCCRQCCPFLRSAGLSRESTIMVKDYSRCDRHSSSDCGTQRTSDPSKKLLSVKMNGAGKYETEVDCKDSLLKPGGHSRKKSSIHL